MRHGKQSATLICPKRKPRLNSTVVEQSGAKVGDESARSKTDID